MFLGAAAIGVIVDKYPKQSHAIIGGSLFCAGLCQALIPYCSSVFVLGILLFCRGLTLSAIDAGSNCLLIRLHGSKSGPWLQALHFFFALGCCVAPLIVRGSMSNSESGEGYN
jgi:fucose permease